MHRNSAVRVGVLLVGAVDNGDSKDGCGNAVAGLEYLTRLIFDDDDLELMRATIKVCEHKRTYGFLAIAGRAVNDQLYAVVGL